MVDKFGYVLIVKLIVLISQKGLTGRCELKVWNLVCDKQLEKMSKNITVAVIGAGVAGVAAAKCALDEGLQVTCFEQDDQIG